MNRRNYYQILHVQSDAPTEVIRSSYRTMMQRLKIHPDLGGDHETAAIVNEAYAVLINPTARAEYDAGLEAYSNPKESEATSTGEQAKQSQSSNIKYHNVDIASRCMFCLTPHNLGNIIEHENFCTECNSTLFPANKQVFEHSGKRIIQRIGKQWPVTFYTQWPDAVPYIGQTQDISLNGMQMLTSISLEEDQVVKITSKTFDAVARVMNYREDFNEGTRLWRIGLEFITLRFYHTQGTFLKLDV